jgi:hypothetical protein
VAFVKRRDQRWKRHVAERARLREERARREREDRARREQARREARLEAKLPADGEDFSSPDDEDAWWEEDELYCPVCDRHFRSKGAFKDHERGRKHLDGVMRLLSDDEGCVDVDVEVDLLLPSLGLDDGGDDEELDGGGDEELDGGGDDHHHDHRDEKSEDTTTNEYTEQQQDANKNKKKKKKRRASKVENESASCHRCGGCGEGFGSRTKLFAHLGAFPGHATRLEKGGKGKEKGKKKG